MRFLTFLSVRLCLADACQVLSSQEKGWHGAVLAFRVVRGEFQKGATEEIRPPGP